LKKQNIIKNNDGWLVWLSQLELKDVCVGLGYVRIAITSSAVRTMSDKRMVSSVE